MVLSGEGRPFHPSVPSSVPSSKFLILGWRRWWYGRTTTTHGGGRRLCTWSCDPISAICLSTAIFFLCGLQEFSRASDGGPATTKTKWRHGEERYQSEAAEEGRHLLSVFFSFWNLSTEVKKSFDMYPKKLDSKMEMWTWCESTSASFWWVPY